MAATRRWQFMQELESRLSLVRTVNGYNTEIGKHIHHGRTIVLDNGAIYEVPTGISDYSDFPYTKVTMLDGTTNHDGRAAPFHMEMNVEVTGVIWAVDNEPLLLEQVHQDLEEGIRFDKLFIPGAHVRYADYKYNARESGEHQGSVTLGIIARIPYCFEYPSNK